MEQTKSLLRKQNIEGISSPDQLDDYLKVTNLGLWAILASLFIMISGILVWFVFGSLTTKLTLTGKAEQGIVTVLTDHKTAQALSEGLEVKILDEDSAILTVLTEKQTSDGFCHVLMRTTLPDGEYPVQIETEHVSPFTFLFSEDEENEEE